MINKEMTIKREMSPRDTRIYPEPDEPEGLGLSSSGISVVPTVPGVEVGRTLAELEEEEELEEELEEVEVLDEVLVGLVEGLLVDDETLDGIEEGVTIT